MFTPTKILLSIELQGGTLIRGSEASKIEWFITLGEVKSKDKKKLPEKLADKVVRRGKCLHYNLSPKPAYMIIYLGDWTFNYMISKDSYEPWIAKRMSKSVYLQLSKEQKLKLHLGKLAEHYGGKSFTFQVIE